MESYDGLVNKYHLLLKELESVPKTDKRQRGCIQFAIDAAYQKMSRHPHHENSLRHILGL
jgi:hypothetical protein